MRSTATFTDGRIHVTLYEGAYDLKALPVSDQLIYEALLEDYVCGRALSEMELSFERTALQACRAVSISEEIQAIYRDLCRRVTVNELSRDVEFAEGLCPWRPEQTRQFVEAALA